jgi:SHS2 domain-containing protein
VKSQVSLFRLFALFGFLLALGTLQSCYFVEEGGEEDRLLAEVYNKKLYYSDIENMLLSKGGGEDSLRWLNAIVDKWVKETLFLYEAERNLPSDINIDALIKDYRATLIINQYEKNYVERQLDSTITEQELQRYYEENKDQYQLRTPIVRVNYIILSKKLPPRIVRRVEDLWKKSEQPALDVDLVSLVSKNSEAYFFDDSQWMTLTELSSVLPKGAINEQILQYTKNFILSDEAYYYYARILEMKSREEVAPLSYIKNQANRVILNKRKLDLINQRKKDLFESANAQNHVKIYLE